MRTDIKLTVAIPYKRRLDNLRIALEGLANQTLDSSEFEVVVGAMEYSDTYISTCREFTHLINLVSVVSSQEFAIPRARNLAMRQASGQILVQMDADTLLPPTALENLYDRHFSFGQNVCVVGQVFGYGNNNDGNVESVEVLPYAHYQKFLDELWRVGDEPLDPRFTVSHVIPWAFAWTGLIALPMETIRRCELFFDEDFHGWGVDDLEWGYRISASGIPIVLREDVYALHLPHTRNMAANQETERANYRRFLRKWPAPDVELAHAVGDVAANSRFLDFQRELRRCSGGPGRVVGTVRGPIGGTDVAVVGVVLDAEHCIVDPDIVSLFDDRSCIEILPLAGLALPYDDGSVAECRVLPGVAGFSAPYWNAVRTEVARIAKRVILPTTG
ncbi:MAG: glycosyltransferase family 2 protein [Acidimicrobiales bacterium]